MWELGQAIAGKGSRKISRRLDLEMGAGSYCDSCEREHYGASLASKGGKLLIGFRGQPKDAVSIAAAPGSGANALFSVYHRTGTAESSDRITWGVRFVATPPVRWKLQKPIRAKEWNVGGAVWTPGAEDVHVEYHFGKGRSGSALVASSTSEGGKKELIEWALGFDAKGKAVCMLFAIPDPKVLAAIDGKVLAEPSAEGLAALHADPHRLALSPKQLNMIAGALKNRGRKLRDRGEKWKGVNVLTKDVRLSLPGETIAKVPSVKGVLCLGNVLEPAKAMKLELGDEENRSIKMTIDTGRCQVEKVEMRGVALSDEGPLRWKVMGDFAPGKPMPRHRDESAVIGLWSPGHHVANDGPVTGSAVHTWYARSDVKMIWVVGYGASGKAAALLVGDACAAAYFDRGGAPEVAFDAQTASAQLKAAEIDTARRMKAAAAEQAKEDAEADGTDVLAPATATELEAIAVAIAAGPSKKKNKIGKRFTVKWDATAIPTVKGKLRVGDPSGAAFDLAAGGDGPKEPFMMFDGEDEGAGAWGRVIVGVRLGAGKVARWKPSTHVGVDSGRYGVWSPGFATSDLEPGTYSADALAAKIVRTSQGDCGFPSLLGLDSAKRPVAFLFGEAVRPAVLAAF
jgi:hypothetical protein